ncbi:hypothetical protein CQY20_18600 [Mycolicibacterium agri]|uniref:DUF732 domain-containing protein n=1 Tax=Mycolicibacterium agri TaxID=36811 RepID=A0A2A7MY58_MYCAG|nr:hypothetical protein [Mycolicibacterium agri]PEG36606.1 hypothetical protein CQY20_18600 [Mycolicibacterium agri]GFG51971.1 hypothetical protein MAGR_34120 [Mycolicibacterium agri]
MASMMKRVAAGTVLGGSMLFTGGMGLASAAPPQVQDGLVNVAVGDVNVVRDVQVEAVAQVLATVCPDVNVEDVNVLAEQVDEDGGTQQVAECTAFTQPVNLTQNGPGNSPNAPGQQIAPGQSNSQNAPGQQTAPGQGSTPTSPGQQSG